jgi:SAM-dependent methyltransferase
MEQNTGQGDQRAQWNSTYDKNKDFFGNVPSELGERALQLFRKEGTRKVLELGCGQGRDTWLFVKGGLRVTAVDYSRSGVCQMQDIAQGAGCSDEVTLLILDARQPLPFPDSCFDAIYSHMFFTMELTEREIGTIMAECLRVLRPGGVNVYSVRNDHDPHFGKGPHKGEDMWQNPMGFVVHYFPEDKVRRLAVGYDVELIREFEDTSPPFTKKLYEVVLRKPRA